MASRLGDLGQLHVQALDGVGRVDHAPNVREEDEERRDVLPGPLPGSDDRRLLGSPEPMGERLQRLLGCLCAGGRHGLAVPPAGVIQAVADQMHDAGLYRRAQGRADGLGRILQAVDHGDQDVLAPLGPEFVEDLEPELGPLGLLDPQTLHVALAVGLHAQCQVDRLVGDPAVVANP